MREVESAADRKAGSVYTTSCRTRNAACPPPATPFLPFCCKVLYIRRILRRPLKPIAFAAVIAFAVFVGGVLYPMWREAVNRNLDSRADPHHIAGNLYFVGTPDLTSFLLIGSEGHVLIGGTSEQAAYKIIDNIEQLGFAAKDVRILLATDPHDDEAGGFAALQQ